MRAVRALGMTAKQLNSLNAVQEKLEKVIAHVVVSLSLLPTFIKFPLEAILCRPILDVLIIRCNDGQARAT